MLKKVTIENYRSCLRTSFELAPNLSVLIGPNGSGKTNILQAILFLNKIAQEEAYRHSGEDVVTANSRITALFRIDNVETRLSASVDAYADASNNDVVTGSRQKWVMTGPKSKKATLEAPLSAARYLLTRELPRSYRRHFSPTQLRRMYVPGKPMFPKWGLTAFGKISDFCNGITYYGASQFTNPAVCPVSFDMEKEGTRRGLLPLRGHAKILYHMYLAHKSAKSRGFEEFANIVGPSGLKLVDAIQFREVTTSSMEHSVRIGGKIVGRRRHKLLIVPQFRIGRQSLSPNQLSEGTFKTLALLFYIVTSEGSALLIEEPEVCIHHGLLSSILELIKTYSRKKQMVLSTHSDYVLDHVEPANVFRVNRDRRLGTSVQHIRETMNSKEFAALRAYLDESGNLGEYWREGGLEDKS